MSTMSLHLDKIEKSYGHTRVLSGVDLKAQSGEFIALVGPSGCGKSTLLRIAAGLDHPDEGRVLLNGHDVTGTRAADRDMAMVFQSYALYPHLTARQNMALPLAMRRLSAWERLPLIGKITQKSRFSHAAIQAEVEQAAEILKIKALLDRKPAQMSGGQRQRVALGRALVRHPQAYLMDEPLSNLDAALRVHTRAEIVDLHKRAGVVTLYVTHDQEEALSMADKVAVMIRGQIMQCDTPAQIYNDPAHLDVASFIGSPRINLIQINHNSSLYAHWSDYLLASKASVSSNSDITIAMRPEHLMVSVEKTPMSLPATLHRTEFLGSEALIHVRLESNNTPLIARATPQQALSFNEIHKLFVSVPPNKILFFDGEGKRLRLNILSPLVDENYAA
jgi:multiple sugar transport system ATP-binding protein